jgi:Mn-dependent DtxR family transcriptional regulator
VIRNNSGRVEVSEIISHLKSAGYDVSAKTINVMIQHALSALAKDGMIDRSERGIATVTAKGSTATVVTEATDNADEASAAA